MGVFRQHQHRERILELQTMMNAAAMKVLAAGVVLLVIATASPIEDQIQDQPTQSDPPSSSPTPSTTTTAEPNTSVKPTKKNHQRYHSPCYKDYAINNHCCKYYSPNHKTNNNFSNYKTNNICYDQKASNNYPSHRTNHNVKWKHRHQLFHYHDCLRCGHTIVVIDVVVASGLLPLFFTQEISYYKKKNSMQLYVRII